MNLSALSSAYRAPTPPTPPTGFESPQEARDGGWMGQVPPADDPPAPTWCPPPPSEPTYANPGMAPEPWKADAPLFPDDPTLFG